MNDKIINKLKKILRIYYACILIFKPKIFIISFQRTGTTSTGKFFRNHNYRMAGYGKSRQNDWTLKWFKGDFNKIFKSLDFKSHQVFQDDPWWCGDFYKVLFHRFPNSKFVLMERDVDRWVESMMNHSNGKSLGNSYRHSKLYRREKEYYNLIKKNDNPYSSDYDNLLELNESHRDHYKNIYQLQIREIKEFFNQFGNERLVYIKLEDQKKWKKLGDYFGFNVSDNYNIHVNKGT